MMHKYGSPENIPHGVGDYRYTTYGCRCDICMTAHAKRSIAYKMGYRYRVPAVGSRRRLRALARLGWSAQTLAPMINLSNRGVIKIRGGIHQHINHRHATPILEVYKELEATEGVNVQAKAWAFRQGWPPPQAWIDVDMDDPNATPRWGALRPELRGPNDGKKIA